MNDFGKDVITPETESYAGQLLTGLNSLYGFLLNGPCGTASETSDESLLLDTTEACEINDYLSEMNPKLIQVSPRILRPDEVGKFKPGEHAGFLLRFDSDGIPIVVNVHGGLRDPRFHADMRDADVVGRNSHTTRTDDTASKPTELNIHSQDKFDIWIKLEGNKAWISKIIIDKRELDIAGSVDLSHNFYQQSLSSLRQAISYFVQLVDNPVSPRR